MQAGIEIGVASTKVYLAMLTLLSMLAPWIAEKKSRIPFKLVKTYLDDLQRLPEKIAEILSSYDFIKEQLADFSHFNDYFYIARGFNFPTALEGALKLKEITYLHAEGYGAGEMKHGPIALVDADLLTIAIAPKDAVYRKMISNIEEIRARQGEILLISDHDSPESHFRWRLKVPETRQEFSPFLTVIPLQILAYELALLRHCDPDQPRNLAKSVTVE
jgi:glucosamine--fructose-6-phosphate aminotransferase (isomerizing)